MSFNTNNYATAPTSPNPYISRKINNIEQAQVMKREREDWSRLYHKTLKGLETILVQSDMDEGSFQVQRMLADELDAYKGKDNKYVEDNIKEIQELYRDEEIKKEKEMIKNEEVILVRPYEVSSSMTSSPSSTSFILDEVENLSKYMKFMKTPSQTRIFRPPPYYQSLKSRGEQDLTFWKEVAMVFLDKKKNMDTSRNGYPILMY